MGTAPEVDFPPATAEFAADPYADYARLRERHPIFRGSGSDVTYFTRHADIVRLLQDRRLGRTMDHTLPLEEVERRRRAAQWERLPCYSRYVRVNLLEMEGADHARQRRALSRIVNPPRIRTLRDRVQREVDELLDSLVPRGRMDFIADLAEPLPVHVIADWLGWPREQRHRLRPWSAAIVRLYEPDHTAADEPLAEAAAQEFAAMIGELIDVRRADPKDDLISALSADVDTDEGLARDELISACMLLLNAGHEATVNGAGNGLLALLCHPEQTARLQADPALMRSAVDELLRFDSPLQLFRRYVLEDMEHDGVGLRRGEQVGFLYGCANRDPATFVRPDELDLARHPNPHLAFGGGKHFCIGAPLARLELELLFTSLLGRVQHLHLVEEPERRPGFVFRGLRSLHVTW
jgi:cytochrome P450